MAKPKKKNKIQSLAEELMEEESSFDKEELYEESSVKNNSLKIELTWKTFLHLAVSIAIVVVLFKFADLDLIELYEQIKATDIFWFSMVALAFLVQIFTNTYRWFILAKLLGYQNSYLKAVHWYFQGQFSNSFLPTNLGGDALRAYKLGKLDRDWIKAASTVLAERLFGFVMMFSLLPVGLVFLWLTGHYAALPAKLYYGLWLLFAGMIIGILSYKLWSRIPVKFVSKIKFAVDEYLQCHKSLSKVVLWTFITHIFLIIANICAAKAVGLSLVSVPIWYWFLLVPVGTLAAFAVPAMKGLGAREASYVYFLSLMSITSEKALAIAFMIYAGMLVASLPGITIVFQKLFKTRS